MPKDFSTMEDSNPSSHPSIHDLGRRTVLRGGVAATVVIHKNDGGLIGT
jgi:hypothetical protein